LPGNFKNVERRAFYEALASEFLRNGALDFDLLELDGRPIAAHFGFRYDETYYLLDGGFDPSVAKLSPGVILTSHVIRRLIADGVRFYDYQDGGEAYKLRWSPESRSYLHLTIHRPGSLGSVMMGLKRARRAVLSTLELQFPSAHRALRRIKNF